MNESRVGQSTLLNRLFTRLRYSYRYAAEPSSFVTSRKTAVIAGYMLGAASLFAAWRIGTTTVPVLALPTIAYQTPVIPTDFQAQITYLSKIDPGNYDTDDGPTVYKKAHRGGWDDCLLYFYNDWCDFTQADTWHTMDDSIDDIPWLIGAPPHIVTARRHGWLSCTDKITQLTSRMSAQELRKSLPVRNNSFPFAVVGAFAITASLTAQLRLRMAA